jgi:nicotinamidase-related amidase
MLSERRRAVGHGLIVIDIQRDYFPGGAHPLVEPEAAASAARRVIDMFRADGKPVVHIQHVSDAPDATFMRPGTDGAEIHSLVAPLEGEPVVQKAQPNSFSDTGLEQRLRSLGVDNLVVVGMMTSMCVDSSVRAGAELGFDVTLVHDACAAPDLEFGGTSVPGAAVHAAFVAAMGDGFATVVSADELTSGEGA